MITMVHLPVRELQDRAGVINVTPAFQFCVQRTYLHSVLAKTSDIVVAAGGVLILVLLNLWNPAVGESTYNNVMVYSIMGIAFLISLATVCPTGSTLKEMPLDTRRFPAPFAD